MSARNCGNCNFYGAGLCRRYPPIFSSDTIAHFPDVTTYTWCGEWKPNNKELKRILKDDCIGTCDFCDELKTCAGKKKRSKHE